MPRVGLYQKNAKSQTAKHIQAYQTIDSIFRIDNTLRLTILLQRLRSD